MNKQLLVINNLRISDKLKEQIKALSIGEELEVDGEKYTKVSDDSVDVESKPKVYSSNWEDYKFERDNTVGTYVIQKPVSANEVESVIVGAFEGGSNYWLGLDNSTDIWEKKPKGVPLSTWATQMLLEGETLNFYGVEEDEEKWTLTLEQLINGFKLNAEERPHDSNVEEGDAITCDCIIQYGIFGKLVYG